jgi:hypothetical protein
MSLVIEYKLKEGFIPTKDTIKTCDEARKAMQNLLIETARTVNPKLTWLMWLLSRFYKRTITKDKISYEFYFFPSEKKHEVSTR